jgi:hypothetical protein
MDDQPRAGPSSPRRSPSVPLRSLKSSDALSPELPPTYNSLDTHVQDKDTDHLIDKSKTVSSRTSHEEEEEELDALRLDLDGISAERPERDASTGGMINVDQRKALWWKNTLITGLFVASW